MDPETTFGRYRVKATLGEGEMGTVYLAEDPAIGRDVAIKTLRRPPEGHEAEGETVRERFDREVRVTGTFTHPNIIPVYDVGLEEDEAFIAMAYVDGGDLRSLMAASKGPLPFSRVIEIVSQVASGLDYAHENKVIHRDIKPANILLTAEGSPMVSDFGVARMGDSTLTQQGDTCGSPSYMSPEQATAQDVTGAADQFSLAIITYEMLTGELPFAGQSITTVMYQIVHTDPAPPHRVNPLIPSAAGEVIMRALSKHPGERYPSCAAYAEALAAALEGTTSAGAPQAPADKVTASTPAQMAATLNTKVVPPGEHTDSAIAEASVRLRGALNTALAFADKYHAQLLIGGTVLVVLVSSVWFAMGPSGDSAGEPEASTPGTLSATVPAQPKPFRWPTSPADGAGSGAGANAGADDQAEAGAEAEEPPSAVRASAVAPTTAPATTTEPEPQGPPSASSSVAVETPDPAPTTLGDEDPEPPVTDDEAPPPNVDEPMTRWTVVAAGTVPEKFVERADNARTVLDEIGDAPEQGIPGALLDRAVCIAVIPNVRKVGLIFGSNYGRGLASCRTEAGWSRPSFVGVGGGGFQLGAQSTDFVLVFVDPAAADRLLDEKFKLGDDVPVAAGPLGEAAEAEAETAPDTAVYAYVRRDGTFEGVSLEDIDVETDEDANKDVYGSEISPRELLLPDTGELPEELEPFLRSLASLVAG